MKKVVRTSTQYVINGREYKSLDEMPPEDRKFFEDANRNGIPDGIESLMANATKKGVIQTTQSEVQRYEVIESGVAPEGGGVLDREAIRKMLGEEGESPGSNKSLQSLTMPPPASRSVSFRLDLKTVLIVALLGVIFVLAVMLLRKG